MSADESIDLATWQPNHPEGTTYELDETVGKVTANLPDGTKEYYVLGGRVQ